MRLLWLLLVIVLPVGCSQTTDPPPPDSHVILDRVFADWLTDPNSQAALS